MVFQLKHFSREWIVWIRISLSELYINWEQVFWWLDIWRCRHKNPRPSTVIRSEYCILYFVLLICRVYPFQKVTLAMCSLYAECSMCSMAVKAFIFLQFCICVHLCFGYFDVHSQFFQINNCDHNMLLLSKLFYNWGVTSLSVLNFSPSLKSCWYQYHSKQWLGSLMKLHMNFYLMGLCPILINQRQYFSALTDAMSSIEDLRSHSRVTFALRKNCKHFN